MSIPSPNQTDNNGSLSDNFSNINMFHNNSELVDYNSTSSSDDPSSPYMLEETPMSPGLDYYINEDMNRNMIDSSTNSDSYGSIYSHLTDNLTMPYVDAVENVQSNMEATNQLFLPSSFTGYGSHGTSANFHLRIPDQPSTVFSPNSFSNLIASNVMANISAGHLFTQTQSTYQQFPPWNWIGYSLTGANEAETSVPVANVRRFPANQPRQIMFAPGSNRVPMEPNYVHSSLEEQYTNIAVAATVGNGVAASSAIAQPIPSFPGIVPANISNESIHQMIFGPNVTLRNLMGSNVWDGIPFESFVQELMRTVEQEHAGPQASFWRSRIIVAVHRAVERMHEGTSGEGSLILDTLANLMENVVGTQTTAHNEHMGLDIENMTYEELLDLQESIGRVNTGLTEEQILAFMDRYEYRTKRVTSSDDLDRCCICLDEYIDGQEVGKLNCAHEFHSDCIKEWLKQRNSCPICKRTGLTT